MNNHKKKNLFFTLFSLFTLLFLSSFADGGDNSIMTGGTGACPEVIGENTASACYVAASNDATACFVIENKNAKMYGVISSDIERKVQILLSQCTDVQNIQLIDVPGSVDDEANLNALLKVYQAGLSTELLANSSVESGGTDFFLAGNKRTVEEGARIGVHSWAEQDSSGNTVEGSSFPWGHEKHQPYINTYIKLGMSQQNAEDFYYFTINAASADSIHYMTSSEISQYMLER